jgi:hypothetical protein
LTHFTRPFVLSQLKHVTITSARRLQPFGCSFYDRVANA